jgi:hypothetical protein
MTLPPSFPQSFYAALNRAAKELGMPRATLATKAIKFYVSEMKKRTSPSAKALGLSGAEDYAEMSRKVSKTWWAKLTPEEKSARAKTAAQGRWGKKKKSK